MKPAFMSLYEAQNQILSNQKSVNEAYSSTLFRCSACGCDQANAITLSFLFAIWVVLCPFTVFCSTQLGMKCLIPGHFEM